MAANLNESMVVTVISAHKASQKSIAASTIYNWFGAFSLAVEGEASASGERGARRSPRGSCRPPRSRGGGRLGLGHSPAAAEGQDGSKHL